MLQRTNSDWNNIVYIAAFSQSQSSTCNFVKVLGKIEFVKVAVDEDYC